MMNAVVEAGGTPNEAVMNQREDRVVEKKGVPDFFACYRKKNEAPSDEIAERDERALKYPMDNKWYRIKKRMKDSSLSFILTPILISRILCWQRHVTRLTKMHLFFEKTIGMDIEWHPRKMLNTKAPSHSKSSSHYIWFRTIS